MAKKMLMGVLAMFFLMGAGSWAVGAISDQWPMSEAAWDAGNGTQGDYGNWYFKWAWSDQWNNTHWSGGYHDAAWDSGNNGWDVSWNQSKNGSNIIRRTQNTAWHDAMDGIIAWQAPENGEITLTVSVQYFLDGYDDATRNIDLSIQKNYDTWLVGNTSYAATKTPQTTSLYSGTVLVSTGDMLYFRTGNASNANGENAAWSISIVPEPATMMLLLAGGMSLLRRRAV